ncbi:protein subunit release factor A [Staphylococcus pasteuri]|uniref:Pathogenicity island protein n=1 Tax=Staphylococcus pasteuri_A TaxID=3062664 RepID=A0AAW7YQL3_9STAP|nr:pathogenicity island protein [Staphylococcus pasteuri_A]MDO6572951.1 pathogenicity island protein [Staphylococcus pasteuri_A]
MNKLTKQEYKNIENKLNYEHIVNNKKQNRKISKLLLKRHNRDVSIIKNEYPNLSKSEITKVLDDYRNYKEFVKSSNILIDFPINYEDSNIRYFITKDDVEELKLAIEEMTSFIGKLEDIE